MMKAKKDRYGLRGEVHFQMAPLIDVVFLLLIFFICVSTFHKTDQVEMILAYARTAEEYKKDEATFVVNVQEDGTTIADGETFLTKSALQFYMVGLVDEVGGPTFKVAIRADRGAEMKGIKDVYRAAAHAGLTRISLITQTRKQEEELGLTTFGEAEAGEGRIY